MRNLTTPRRAVAVLASVCLILTAGAVSHAASTVFHYRTTDTTVLPNIPSIGGADGTAQGSLSLSADVPTVNVPAGAGNRSISANAAGARVRSAATRELTNALVMANGGFTYETWFKWNGGGSFNAIIDYAGTEKFRMKSQGGGNYVLDLNFDSGSGVQPLVVAPTPNEWHYIAAVFDYDGNPEVGGKIGGALTWYYDGNVPTGTASVVKDDFGDSLNRPIGVGNHPTGGGTADLFDGLVYEPRVTLGALTPAQLLIDPAPQLVQPGGAGAIGEQAITGGQQNLAPGGTASQSTDYSGSYPASNAIDGNYGNFSHTHSNDNNPWWQVDLGAMTGVDNIQIYNRSGYGHRLVGDGGFRVDVLEGDGTTVAWTQDYVGATFSTPFPIDLSGLGIDGQIVKLSKLAPLGGGDNKTFNLAEVEVWATIPGDFTMFNGGTLEIELAADLPAADKLALTGELTIEPGATLDVLLLSGSPAPGQMFDILDFGSVVGTFDTVNLPGGAGQWDTTSLYTTGEITYAAAEIPEPMTMALAALGFAGLGGYIRRRRRA